MAADPGERTAPDLAATVVEAAAREVAPHVAGLLLLGDDAAARRLDQLGGCWGGGASWDIRGRRIRLHTHAGLSAARVPRPWTAQLADVFAWLRRATGQLPATDPTPDHAKEADRGH